MRDEGAGQTLDAIGARLAEGFAAVAVAADFVVAQLAHADLRDRDGFQQLIARPDGHGGRRRGRPACPARRHPG
ncbi:hypothetical protein G6F40_017821 [Rhizopus arrhizus]|nr:hypothetical protein G6F40_017821 [Rhizopus arrhizus]KAG1386700.1 hypothetical protein G6F58_013785 [Rhizopus delemar]